MALLSLSLRLLYSKAHKSRHSVYSQSSPIARSIVASGVLCDYLRCKVFLWPLRKPFGVEHKRTHAIVEKFFGAFGERMPGWRWLWAFFLVSIPSAGWFVCEPKNPIAVGNLFNAIFCDAWRFLIQMRCASTFCEAPEVGPAYVTHSH